jgi:hypothetical protein
MATLETQQVDAIIDNSRRKMLTVGGAALAGLALAGYSTKAMAAVSDTDILNFALNLEYLEANYYNLAVYGVTIDQLTAAQGGPISIIGGQAAGSGGTVVTKPSFTPVAFTPFASGGLIGSYATETALEEGKHVSFLSTALGSAAVAQPMLDLYNSFNTLAAAAGLPSPFDPFASENNFLIGAYIFEDTGVSAYHGAAPLISDKAAYLGAAVGIHAVEAYHAGLIRTTIAGIDVANGNTTLSGYTVAISNLRLALSAPAEVLTDSTDNTPSDVGLTTTTVALNGSTGQYTAATIVDAPIATNSIAQGRNANQILAIVTAANSGGGVGVNTGLFYPNGLNGNIK